MLRSLAIVGVCVAVVAILPMMRTAGESRDVDPTPVLAAATEFAPFAASVPPETPAGWRVTSARISAPDEEPFAWFVGYVTEAGRFVAVTESDGERSPFLTSVGVDRSAAEDGTSRIRGDVWARLADADGLHRTLVREDTAAGVLTVVTGTADYEVLDDFAATLRSP